MTNYGKFIVIEGLDGSGATTQVELLVNYLKEKGLEVYSTKEPTDNVIGGLIRGALTGVYKLPDTSLQLLFSADRGHHLSRFIEPALNRGFWVVCDRYMWSTVSFGSITLDKNWLLDLQKFFRIPDLSIFLDVDPKECIKRIKKARPPLEEIYGTLPDWVIKEYIKKGTIKINPLPKDWEKDLGTVTIDFRLGLTLLVPKRADHLYVDTRVGVDEALYDIIRLQEGQAHIMAPQQFIIAPTLEELELPDDFLARLEGRSSLARLGIVVHLSSGRFDPGWKGRPVLELKNNGFLPVIIYGGDPVCAFSFERLMTPVERPYTTRGRYAGDVVISRI